MPDRRHLLEHVEQVGRGQERVAREGEDEEEHDDADDDHVLAQQLERAGDRRQRAARDARRAAGAAPSSDTAEHRPHDRLLVRLVPRVLAHDPPGAHHDDAMREPEHLAELAGDQQHAEPVGGEPVDQLVDRALGPDVDAARRLVGEQQPSAS